jgi:hypothetical protein
LANLLGQCEILPDFASHQIPDGILHPTRLLECRIAQISWKNQFSLVGREFINLAITLKRTAVRFLYGHKFCWGIGRVRKDLVREALTVNEKIPTCMLFGD